MARSVGETARSRAAARPSSGDPEDDGRKGVQSVDTAFAILRVLEQARRPLSLGDLSRLADQPRSKVHHYLVSLMRNRVVTQNAAGHYDLGEFSFELGLSALNRLDAIEEASKAAIAFRDETGEATFVAVWGNRGPTIVRYVEGVRPLTVELRAGLVMPPVSSATGLVFLAWLPAAKWEAMAHAELVADGVADPQARIAATLETVRREGAGTTHGGVLPRISAISVPVFGHDGRLALALTTLGWRDEISVSPTGVTARRLIDEGHALSKRLGFRPEP